jgi:hypothetical protein
VGQRSAPRTPLTDDEVRRSRLAAQRLHRPARGSVRDLVRHLVGVQAQVLSASGLAVSARTTGLTVDHVDRARERDRSIVLTWAMRGTLHLISSDDHRWLVPLVIAPRIPNAHRRLRQEGVPGGRWQAALRSIGQMLETEGPLTRPEIADRLQREGVRTAGQAIAHLVWLAAATGLICMGPGSGRDQRFVLVRDWLDRSRRSDRGPSDPMAELAVRYLRAHGPATPADLAFWSGIRPGDANRAWTSVARRLIQVDTSFGHAWRLRSASAMAPPGSVRLLPSFDEYLLGWRNRDLLATTSEWRRINRGGGWLHPVVLGDGRALGTWRMEHGHGDMSVEVSPFTRLQPSIRRGVADEARKVGAFLGAAIDAVTTNEP